MPVLIVHPQNNFFKPASVAASVAVDLHTEAVSEGGISTAAAGTTKAAIATPSVYPTAAAAGGRVWTYPSRLPACLPVCFLGWMARAYI